jgi:hypothetical protein
MSQPPGPYERSYSFTDFSTNNPNAQQPGQKIDQELNNVRTALNATQDRLGEVQADDGKLRESCLRMETLGPAVAPYVSQSAIDAINQAGGTQLTAVNTAGSTQVGAVNAAGASNLASLNAVINSTAALQATQAATSANYSKTLAQQAKTAAEISAGNAHSSEQWARTYQLAAEEFRNQAQQFDINAQQCVSAAQGYVGSAESLKNEANQAATLSEYYKNQADDAAVRAETAAASANSVISNALPGITSAANSASLDAATALSAANQSQTFAQQASYSASAASTSANAAAVSAATIVAGNYLQDAPSDGQNYARNNGSWVTFGGSWTGGAVSSDITYASGTNYATFNYGYVATQSNDSNAYGVIYNNGVEAGDGNVRTLISSAGVTFPDNSVQDKAAYVVGSGDLDMMGSNINNGNFNSPAGQVSAQNVSMSSGGVLTFGDSSVQSTAAKEAANVQDISSVNGVYVPAFGNTVYAFASCGVDIHLPSHSVYPLPIGTQMIFINKDGSGIGFSSYGTGDGATVYSSGSRLTLNAPYAIATAIKIESNIWVVSGDLTA